MSQIAQRKSEMDKGNGGEDTTRMWKRGAGPIKPLTLSYEYFWFQGWTRAAREKGGGSAYCARHVDGYIYEPSPAAAIGQSSAAARNKLQRLAERQVPERWAREWLPQIKGDLARFKGVELKKLEADELGTLLHETLLWYSEHGYIHAHMGGTTVEAVARFVDWYLERFPAAAESEPYKLLQGQYNLSLEKGHRLYELSCELTPAMVLLLVQRNKAKWDELPAEFVAAVDDFVGDYWGEDRERVARWVLIYRDANIGDPLVELSRLASEREAFRKSVRGELKKSERAIFDDLLDVALANNPLTEDHNYWLDGWSMHVIDEIADEFGRRLCRLGVLRKRGEVQFLEVHELMRWAFGLVDPLPSLVQERQRMREAHIASPPPPTLGAEGPLDTRDSRFWGPAKGLPAAEGELRGVGASAGIVRGSVRKARNLKEALALRAGEILVCERTDPQWTPLFALAAGLLSDLGGSLCHGAVLAREYRLPAIMGLHKGMRSLRNGQQVEVDGAEGVVRLLH